MVEENSFSVALVSKLVPSMMGVRITEFRI